MTNLATANKRPSETVVLAMELAADFAKRVQFFKQHFSHDEAVAQANESNVSYLERILQASPDQVSWSDLEELAKSDGDRGLARWEEIKQAALEELQTGFRASRSVENYHNGPWQRAQFLAIRSELANEWQPRNGIERQLLDVMAQSQAS